MKIFKLKLIKEAIKTEGPLERVNSINNMNNNIRRPSFRDKVRKSVNLQYSNLKQELERSNQTLLNLPKMNIEREPCGKRPKGYYFFIRRNCPTEISSRKERRTKRDTENKNLSKFRVKSSSYGKHLAYSHKINEPRCSLFNNTQRDLTRSNLNSFNLKQSHREDFNYSSEDSHSNSSYDINNKGNRKSPHKNPLI
jgi:hypothetical protein